MNMELTSRLSAFRETASRLKQQYAYDGATLVRLQAKIDQLEKEKAQLVKAVGLIDKCIELISANGIGRIEAVVSSGLRHVYGQGSELGLVIEKKEGARGYSYRVLIQEGETVGNAMDSFGGGVQNIAAFLLRVILIKRFKLAKLLMLDESFSNLGNGTEPPVYLRRVCQYLRTLCDDHGFTILAVTHQPILAESADLIYKVETKSKHPELVLINVEQLNNARET